MHIEFEVNEIHPYFNNLFNGHASKHQKLTVPSKTIWSK